MWMPDDLFRACREAVTAEEAARRYGLTFDRRGWALCPFHPDKHPSMSFKAGRFRCWACGESGDAIDFTGKLFGLSPLDAVRRLDQDFNLHLPLDRRQMPAERRETERAAQKRRELADTAQAFEAWRNSMLDKLTSAIRVGNMALKKPLEGLSSGEALAVQRLPALEWWADLLCDKDMGQRMRVFRDREGVTALCTRILNSTPLRSGAA